VTASHCYSDERLLESKRRRPRYRAEDVMRALALGFILLFVSTVAGAQQAAAGRRLCLDAEALPACRSFIVTEAHVLARLGWAATAAGGLLAAAVGEFP
jgi:hypothetical protein